MQRVYEISEIRPRFPLEFFFSKKPPQLWCLGETEILNRNLLGIISARETESELALEAARLIKHLASLEGTAFISGWHSPLERESLRLLLRERAEIVFCTAKSIDRFTPSREMQTHMGEGRALLLTHCTPRAKRISRDASLRRNYLVAALAKVLCVLSAPPDSSSLQLAKTALEAGTRVLTLEHFINKDLLALGALPATLKNIQSALNLRKD